MDNISNAKDLGLEEHIKSNERVDYQRKSISLLEDVNSIMYDTILTLSYKRLYLL